MSEYAYEVDKCFGITYRVEAPDLNGLEAAAKRMGMSPVVVCGIEPAKPGGDRTAKITPMGCKWNPEKGEWEIRWDVKSEKGIPTPTETVLPVSPLLWEAFDLLSARNDDLEYSDWLERCNDALQCGERVVPTPTEEQCQKWDAEADARERELRKLIRDARTILQRAAPSPVSCLDDNEWILNRAAFMKQTAGLP